MVETGNQFSSATVVATCVAPVVYCTLGMRAPATAQHAGTHRLRKAIQTGAHLCGGTDNIRKTKTRARQGARLCDETGSARSALQRRLEFGTEPAPGAQSALKRNRAQNKALAPSQPRQGGAAPCGIGRPVSMWRNASRRGAHGVRTSQRTSLYDAAALREARRLRLADRLSHGIPPPRGGVRRRPAAECAAS